PELGRSLAELPHPKAAVASFAERVCRAWMDGDDVAGAIVKDSVKEMAEAVRAVAVAIEAPGPVSAVVVGGVAAGCPAYLALLCERIHEDGGGPVELAPDPSRVSLQLAVADRAPPDDDSGFLAAALIAAGAGA